MTKEEQKKLLHDKWPSNKNVKKEAFIKALEKASKAKLFEYKENPHEFIEQK